MPSFDYRPPLEVPDHNHPCWKQWFERLQVYRETEPAASIAAHAADPGDPHAAAGYLQTSDLVTNPVLLLLMAGA